MATDSRTQRNFILMPMDKLNNSTNAKVSDFMAQLSAHAFSQQPVALNKRSMGKKPGKINIKVLDSIHETGPKLVTVNQENLAEIRLSYPGIRIIPETKYLPAWAPQLSLLERTKTTTAKSRKTISFHVADGKKNPLTNARVVVLIDYINRIGEEGRTNKRGDVMLSFNTTKPIERIYVFPEHSAWPLKVVSPRIISGSVELITTEIDISFEDSLKHFYRSIYQNPISDAVTVAVIDTGVDAHKDLPEISGQNMIRNQPPDRFNDVLGHGTHVAGIIGAMGDGVKGMRGIAAGCTLRSYRVFPSAKRPANNFDIMKAIDLAITDGCDFINLSLGGVAEDGGVASSISDAYDQGVVCFAAAGNSNRSPVCFPAASQFSVAVSAMGVKNLWPKGATQEETVKNPLGKNKNHFIASFSNIGQELDLTAPGVGIASTYKGDNYAIMDGTSMACPVVTGMAARILNSSPNLLTAKRDSTRSNELLKLLSARSTSLGFPANLEGKGLLQ